MYLDRQQQCFLVDHNVKQHGHREWYGQLLGFGQFRYRLPERDNDNCRKDLHGKSIGKLPEALVEVLIMVKAYKNTKAKSGVVF